MVLSIVVLSHLVLALAGTFFGSLAWNWAQDEGWIVATVLVLAGTFAVAVVSAAFLVVVVYWS